MNLNDEEKSATDLKEVDDVALQLQKAKEENEVLKKII